MAICSPHNGFAIAVVLAIVDFFFIIVMFYGSLMLFQLWLSSTVIDICATRVPIISLGCPLR